MIILLLELLMKYTICFFSASDIPSFLISTKGVIELKKLHHSSLFYYFICHTQVCVSLFYFHMEITSSNDNKINKIKKKEVT